MKAKLGSRITNGSVVATLALLSRRVGLARLASATVASLAFLGGAAGGAGAAVTVGADTSSASSFGAGCASCTYVDLTLPSPRLVRVPFDGVLVRWRVRGADGAGQMNLRVVRSVGADKYTGKGTSAPGMSVVHAVKAFPTQLRVKRNDLIGLDVAGGGVEAGFAGGSSGVWSPPLADEDPGQAPYSVSNYYLLYNADVERDCDGDGRGDETQDSDTRACNPPVPALAVTAPDTTAPSISRLSLSPRTFRLGKRRPAKVSAVKTGSRIAFTLSEAARVTFGFERRRSGRRVGGRCKTKTTKNAKHRRCARWVRVKRRSFSAAGKPGKNKVRFQGRTSKHKRLSPGRYRLIARARDSAGNLSKRKRAPFRLLRTKRK